MYTITITTLIVLLTVTFAYRYHQRREYARQVAVRLRRYV